MHAGTMRAKHAGIYYRGSSLFIIHPQQRILSPCLVGLYTLELAVSFPPRTHDNFADKFVHVAIGQMQHMKE